MNKKTRIYSVVAVAGLILVGVVWYLFGSGRIPNIMSGYGISNFAECEAAGNPVMESYPRQCRAGSRTFVEEIVTPPQTENCVVGGCSGQVCAEANEVSGIITTCEFRPEYACYKKAQCTRQANGRCGWTQDGTLVSCLQNPPSAE